jgi:hypothetical protein
MDNEGFEPPTIRSLRLLCKAEIIPLDQLPLYRQIDEKFKLSLYPLYTISLSTDFSSVASNGYSRWSRHSHWSYAI